MVDDKLSLEIDGLDYAVEKSMRYHQRRRGFYDSFHKAVMFLIVVLGSAAFAEVIVEAPYLAAAAAVLAAIHLVWGLSNRARDHEILFRRFSDLAIKIRSEEATSESYASWKKERISIETDEPPIFKALEADCDNEVRHAWGRDKKLVHVGLWSRLTMNWRRHAKNTYV